jgi:hypothetical protein
MYEIVKSLPFGEYQTVYKEGENAIKLFRPIKKFKNYNPIKNFQIFINDGARFFRPNHLRIMIDLHLRVRSRPELKNELLKAFDAIFYQQDPDEVLDKLSNEKFEHNLNNIKLIGNLSQLFIIEQDYNYTAESKYDPCTLFYQGWVRQSIDSSKEIDNLVMSICSRQPPATKYTSFENKKQKKYSPDNLPPYYQ